MTFHPTKNVLFYALLSIGMGLSVQLRASDFETIKGWDGHLFPSYILATSTATLSDSSGEEEDESDDEFDEDSETSEEDDSDDENEDSSVIVLGDTDGLLGVRVVARESDQPIKVTISCDTIMAPSVFTSTLPEAGSTYEVFPKIKYNFDLLAKRLQTGPITVSYKVELGDEELEKTEILTLRTVNDCPYSLYREGEWKSVRFMFAAYVNEQHPFVDNILREALDTRIVNSFAGYQRKDKAEVYRQVYALWHALSLRDVRYSSITNTVAISKTVGSQHIRMIDESINHGQANCVDGSVLLASLLRKIQIEPILVHVPGHCYLAFYLDAEGKELAALETTMIGLNIEGDAIEVDGMEDVVDDEAMEANSWKTFAAAIARGTENFEDCAEKFQDETDLSHQLISVSAARKAGILPIAFLSNEKFVAAPRSE